MAVSMLDMLIPAALVIITGLLFIDLVPLQETMVCDDYGNATACADYYFSQTYDRARSRFLEAAAKAGAVVESHVVAHRDGRDYHMDTALLQRAGAPGLLVHASGTHGIEGYTGSAIQTQLLETWNASRAAGGPSVLFVHAVNPYGMANYRRFNENNVDLNRNYLSAAQWAEVRARDPNVAGYETLRDVLSPAAPPRLIDRYLLLARFVRVLARHGFGSLKKAFVTGQYHHPEGIYYGGAGEQTSVTTLRRILHEARDKTSAARAIFIDVHTGLGPTGVDTIMTSTAEDAARAKAIFAGTRVQSDRDATDGPSAGYHLVAGVIRPVAELGPETLAVTEEFGTVNPIFVARAVILENAANTHAPGSHVHHVMGDWMRDVFYPQTLAYKRSTLQLGAANFWRAFDYLK